MVLEVLVIAVTEEKEIKQIQIGKEEAKLSLSAYDILYREKSKDTTKKFSIDEFSKFSGYKINIQISTAFLYTNNKLPEKETKEIIPFNIASKRITYLRINLPKEAAAGTLSAAESYPMSEVRGSGLECQAVMAQERSRGATPCPRSGAAAERSHPTSKARGGARGQGRQQEEETPC